MSDVYHPPAFQFYVDDFVAGTMDFTAEEVGAYWLLICHAWANGGIPNDMSRIARIARLTPAELKRSWSTISPKFRPHPTNPDLLVQPRQETVRAKAEEHAKQRAENGLKGGRPKKPSNNLEVSPEKAPGLFSETETEPEGKAKKSSPISVLLSPSNYVSLRETAIASYPTIPEGVETLAGLAAIFVHRFANCADLNKAKKHLPQYIGTLNVMRERGLTVSQAWKAFEDAWKANSEVPLWGAQAKNAISFLPGRIAQKYTGNGSGRSARIPYMTEADL